jgi:hypothetical protein
MAFDPLNFLTFGGTAAAKAATKGGANAVRGIAHASIPFTNIGATIGTGARSQAFLRGLDTAKDAVRYSGPGRELARLFNPRVMNTNTTVGQKVAQQLYDAQTGAQEAARGVTARAGGDLHRAGMSGADQDEIDALYRMFEGAAPPRPDLAQTYSHVHDTLDQMVPNAQEWGVRLQELVDPEISYFPRRIVERSTGPRPRPSGQPFSAFDPGSMHRADMLRGIGEGTATIRRLGRDTAINQLIDSGADAATVAAEIKSRYGHLVPDTYDTVAKYGKNAGQPIAADRYKALAQWLASLSPETRQAGIYAHPLASLESRFAAGGNALEAAKAVLQTLADPKHMQAAQAASKSGRSVRVADLLNDLRFNLGDETGGALRKLAELKGTATPDAKTLDIIGQSLIPEELAHDLTRLYEGFRAPEAVGKIGQLADTITNLTKAGLTGPWPAFHARNLLSGQVGNWTSGLLDSSRAPAAIRDAFRVMRGQGIDDAASIPLVAQELAARGLPASEATNVLRELAYKHGLTGGHNGEALARSGPEAFADNFAARFPGGLGGSLPFNAADTARRFAGRTPDTNLNPFDVRGVGGRTETRFGPVAAGEDLGQFVEGLNRLAPWLEQIRKGVDPSEAAKKVAQAQVDYSPRAFTVTERKVLARLFPFYKFTSRQLPHTLRTLAEQPGGRLAKTIQATNLARGDEPEMLPEHVADTAAIPFGQTADGSKRYLTGFGLMHEDPLGFFGSGLKGAGLEALSRMNPLVKGPLEFLSGQSFFQKGPEGGRSIDDLDPSLGRLLANVAGSDKPVPTPQILEQVLANSPVSRLLSSARTLTDRRKHLSESLPVPGPAALANLLTGVRFTDVSPAAQDALLRDTASKIMRDTGAKTFEKVYFPEDVLAGMSPEEQKAATQLMALKTLLASRAKERKQTRQQRQLAEVNR